MSMLDDFGNLVALVISVYCGFAGNDWRMASLARRGFGARKGIVEAPSAREALRKAGAEPPGGALPVRS